MEENNKKSEAALREEKVLEFWRENKTFEKSLSKDSPKGNYVFYDGPPFATGQMHYGHILGSTAKDVIGRYQTMQGYHVPRKWGWDCHGLPIEHLVEKELKIAGHNEIEKLGIDKFVEYARSKVLQFDKDWEVGVERIGRWVDFKNGYKTMDNTFMESVWWALGEMNKKGLVYEGVRVLAYCARCETPIANSEIAMDNSYKDIADISVYVKFELEDEPGTYLLAWTTTPWTLPGNTAIAVNKDVEYVKVKSQNSLLVVAKQNIESLKDKFVGYEIVEEFKGEKLLGKKYKPIFPYYLNSEVAKNENIWKVWHADFVTIEKGTGMAHEAPAFGEDDMNLAKANNIPWIIHVDEEGKFKPEVTDFAGMKVKPKGEEKDAHQKADIEVIKWLARENPTPLFAKEKIMHSYPHCMRCDTPIIYYALPSWFINIQKAKEGILENAKTMTWIPAHLKEGRFKHIAENAPDWNISRNRYWATPLPIWKCSSCHNLEFVSSLEDLKNKSKKSGNKYFVMRHGEAEHNIAKTCHANMTTPDLLTDEGVVAVKQTAEELKDKNITTIYCSPFERTKMTAKLVANVLGLNEDAIIIDSRIEEFKFGDFHGKPFEQYMAWRKEVGDTVTLSTPNGESVADARQRIAEFFYDIDKKNSEENILVVTHGILLESMPALVHGYSDQEMWDTWHMNRVKPGSFEVVDFVPLSHNARYELDLHRPYIDEVKLLCECGSEMTRITEVMDCWFESGSMPFAQDHYPFENPKWQENNFPAGFVAEYIAQTRTWFYYSHVVSSILFNHAPYENVVTTGTVRAEDGQKMSKSKNNYPDPWAFINKYGVDALRIYLMSSPLMKGEDSNFSEKLVQEISSKFVGRLSNVVAFYELYRDKDLESNNVPDSNDVLDKWILSRFSQLVEEMTKWMNAYEMALAIAPLDKFIDDLSTWYLRRSRDRIKDGDKSAKQTMYFVLKNLTKLMAPFAPFCTETEWQKLRHHKDEESVHLASWPVAGQVNEDVLSGMMHIRAFASNALMQRMQAGIKVRQVLQSFTLKHNGPQLNLWEDLVEVLKEEINVKEVLLDNTPKGEEGPGMFLDLVITPELKKEGDYRELVRGVQDLRKHMGLVPSDMVTIIVDTDDAGRDLLKNFEEDFVRTVGGTALTFAENSGTEIKVESSVFKVQLVK